MDKMQYKINDSVINVSKETLQELMYKDFFDDTHIGINLLKFILDNDDVFIYTSEVFGGIYKKFTLEVKDDENPIYNTRCTISKMKLYDALFSAHQMGLLDFDEEVLDKLDILGKYMTFDYFEEQNKDKFYGVAIEGEYYEVKCSDMFEFISLKPWDFSEKIKHSDTLYGIKREYFLYAVNSYFQKNYIKSKYILNKYQDINVDAITHQLYVDIQAINKLLNTDDEIYKDVEISQELRDYLFKGMNEEFSLLEKIIYIYIKLCKALTYDAEFYAGKQRGKVAEKHKDIKHIKDITLDNNDVVCYEFNAIFTKILYEYGINYSCSHIANTTEEYGQGHINVEFRIGKFLILADAITSVFTGDLFQAKVNNPIKGFICLNINSDSMVEFRKSLEKVVKYIQEELDYSDMSLEELLNEYKNNTDNIKSVPFRERLDIAIEKINGTKVFKPMDMYAYIMTLGNILFTPQEHVKNIKFAVIKNNDVDEDKVAMPLGILSVNEEGFLDNPDNTEYYIYDIEVGIIPTTLDEIKDKFKNNIYEHISERVDKIPGINMEGKGLK